MLKLLEQVAGKPARKDSVQHGPYAQAVLASEPLAYWQLDDIEGLTAVDSTRNRQNAVYEGNVALYLAGLNSTGLSSAEAESRAAHLAGGRLRARLSEPVESYSVELWFWNGLPSSARAITGHLLSFDFDVVTRPSGGAINIGIGGTEFAAGRLFLSASGVRANLVGNAEIASKTWHHFALVHYPDKVVIYLDGKSEPDIKGQDLVDPKSRLKSLIVGGRENGLAGFEGKIDEVALFKRALGAQEITRHFDASGVGKKHPTATPR
jgi:hypothetical protein